MFRIALFVFLVSISVFFSACQNSGSSSTTDGAGGQVSSSANLVGLDPDTSWHESYIVGAHSGYACATCHDTTARAGQRTATNEEICYLCHMDDYNATSLLNHSQYSIGTYCNSCHYSDSFTSNIRISHETFHSDLTGSCDSCHSGASPSNHYSGACESCHAYPKWSDATFSHGATSGCNDCHLADSPSNHYGTSCESCHTYPSWTGAAIDHSGLTSGCENCHAGDIAEDHAVVPCAYCHSYPSWDTDEDAHKDSGTDCVACHTNGNFDDDDDDDEKDDDDDDEKDDDD